MIPTSVAFEKPSLGQFVLAVLSLAAIQGRDKVKMSDFYSVIADCYTKFPEMFPVPMRFRIDGGSPYSERLEDALNIWLPGFIGVDIFNRLLISPATGIRNLASLREWIGDDYIDSLGPLLDEFFVRVPERTWRSD
jgi:hypothetical protein